MPSYFRQGKYDPNISKLNTKLMIPKQVRTDTRIVDTFSARNSAFIHYNNLGNV